MAAFVGVDWGTTRLRAHAMDENGAVVGTVETGEGLMAARPDGFSGALTRALEQLDVTGLPVVMSGMVGSRQGWVEAPYADCPASFAAIADHAVAAPFEGADVHILAGVAQGRDQSAPPDVMRGEETEIVGAMSALGVADGVFVLPGTHTKWASVEDGRITGFRTFMTGDVFAALKGHTVLSAMMGQPTDWAAFEAGVTAPPIMLGDAMAEFFSLRAEALLVGSNPDASASRLSGRLIGAEIASALGEHDRPILVGSGVVRGAYERAFAVLGHEVVHAPRDCAARGLALAARYWGWI